VKNITDFGAFVDIRGVIGLLQHHGYELGQDSHPSEIVSVGSEIDVVILDFDKTTMKISLGLKQTMPNPWDGVDSKFPVGPR
jgi:4-hydroxy-3-methylbut-2-enyl diphosphate reductase